MALGDSFPQPPGGGLLTDALDNARQPIREFLSALPDPLSQPKPGAYATLASFPPEPNPFLSALQSWSMPSMFGNEPSPSAYLSAATATMPIPMGALATARAEVGGGPSQMPNGPTGALARARQAASLPTGQTAAQYHDLFASIGAEEGVPADYLAAIAETEATPDGRPSPAGAVGIMQVVPGQGYDAPGENPSDPATSIRQGARALRQKYEQTGSWDEAIRAYFGYGVDAGGVSTDQYAQRFQQNLQRIRAQTPQSNGLPATTPPTPAQPLAGITAAQYGSESLATGAADYICGPIAAQAFVKSQGRNPTLQEALDLARHLGVIDPSNGMHGIDSTVALIRGLGGVATTGPADPQRIAQEVQSGRPVILNTRNHYFVAEGYDPSTGRFDFGNSAKALRSSGGNSWYTLDELANLTIGTVKVGLPRGAIYASY